MPAPGAARRGGGLALLLAAGSSRGAGGRAAYKAASFEYTARGYDEGGRTKQESLADYAAAARRAAGEGAQIIVFPEYGITGYSGEAAWAWQRYGFSEVIPSAAGDTPCSATQRYESAPSIVKLSCIAKEFAIAVVANLMDFEDGNIYNTDVAFDTDGRFLLKYHKLNRWGEQSVSIDQSCHPASFTTSFGVKFGVMTCADFLWEHPGMDLIRDGVYDFAVPVDWDNTYAHMQILAYVQGWSHVHGVNVITSNGHSGPRGYGGTSGSGVFASGFALDSYYHPSSAPGAVLRVATVPAAAVPPPPVARGAGAACPERRAAPPSGWTFGPLSAGRLCAGGVCCEADVLGGQPEGFALAALDGVDLGPGGASGEWPAQACAVLPCASPGQGCLYYQEPTGRLSELRLRMTGAEFCASYPVAEVSGCDSRAPGACGQRLLQPGHGQAGTFELKSEMTAATVLANWTELQGGRAQHRRAGARSSARISRRSAPGPPSAVPAATGSPAPIQGIRAEAREFICFCFLFFSSMSRGRRRRPCPRS